ncbi:hypothetical protein QJS66_21325 [Kocuria rhizophila]|nr:hypothetical protein QJS66_21325 [Kocuria rhizophila]
MLVLAVLAALIGSLFGDPELWVTRAGRPRGVAVRAGDLRAADRGRRDWLGEKFGVIIKSGAAFERFGAIRDAAVDKTGTLTGCPSSPPFSPPTDDRGAGAGVGGRARHSTHRSRPRSPPPRRLEAEDVTSRPGTASRASSTARGSRSAAPAGGRRDARRPGRRAGGAGHDGHRAPRRRAVAAMGVRELAAPAGPGGCCSSRRAVHRGRRCSPATMPAPPALAAQAG